MKILQDNNGHYFLLLAIVIASLIWVFSSGIPGNDFWWHVKAGEWMVSNMSLPRVDIFSWYARENNIEWSSHEWLSQVMLYLIHHHTGNIGIFIFSLSLAILMTLLIMHRNRDGIKNNILVATLFLFPMSVQMKIMFYGRPHLISFFLIYLTLYCLYRLRDDEDSNLIFLVPVLACLWANLHGGSSVLSYIMCFIALFSGLFSFSYGKLESTRFSPKQFYKYAGTGVLTIFALLFNPYGLDMLVYPYANMGDSFMQTLILEWSAPDAKILAQLIFFYFPLFVVGSALIVTDRKIQFLDFLMFTFFSYMFLRSQRFVFIFFLSSTFYVFNYFVSGKVASQNCAKSYEKVVFLASLLALLMTCIMGISAIKKTADEGKLISVALSDKFVELVIKEKPVRLFNEYGFGETLIYNGIATFVDARADLYSPHNLRDYKTLYFMTHLGTDKLGVFDPEAMIASYAFDAFIIRPKAPLAGYLMCRPDRYQIIMQDAAAVYFKNLSK